MLEVKNLCCGYDGNDVIHNISFNINRGENISIIGPNGCGKSTILKALANLIEYRGEIKLDGVEIKKIKRKELAKKVALMSQNSEIYFSYTVFETVALGRYAHIDGIFSRLSNEDKDIVLKCIESVGLLEEKDKLINELSGGQLQRVYLARAFAQEPDILLLDEPTNHLDLKCQIEILDYINKWTKENNKTVIGVLHDLNLVQMFSKDVILVKEGEIYSSGKAREILNSSKIKDVYKIDIRKFMLEALEKWK
ncbi:ABC transporter ATP-binding protein [Clostridium sp. LIBA-8841]|uniref:ABC transporter ATP-binding protein n=1 Tax=Clostridium sp. LIBA-8841 TaxID=2987530 RepID=UPI002AC49CCE|nr:ABC transporter ATP-binding protein [Clostridium sp. LIBA-8841]MDZ5253344.1 ABC transporter ATP-binding protein [Clostridium sp. LIBA-8841]